ncbi:hypothetical protein CgunFtcFv8_011905 [Champsocephalus gunnari]|uniref:Uncharacterized protein n=1 Tax=Champsocephalus gunnari TaxID=52237 RepID=A0AAN8D6G6_CHAGU|nr:hypothetical protein CgunFtcFv8_011905 [Champsocephalus gunnari]
MFLPTLSHAPHASPLCPAVTAWRLTCNGSGHFQKSVPSLIHYPALCCGSTTWGQTGISLYQARTGEGLDLSERIDSHAAVNAGAVLLPRPLPHSHSLMGPALTTDPNCL